MNPTSLVVLKIRQGDVLTRLREMPAESVQCVVTSPPYWGLRDYGTPGQIGLEPTPEAYVAKMVEVFAEVRRVLRRDGTLWLNLGDSYATGAGSVGNCPGGGDQGERWNGPTTQPNRMRLPGLKPKDLVGIPWRVAFALQADGWYLRSDIIWSKPNPMPESVTDRPTKAHEYLFLLAKAERYFFDADAVREPDKGQDHARAVLDGQPSLNPSGGVLSPHRGIRTLEGRNGSGRNIRSVWTIATQPFHEAHFATFPEKLVEPCIKAGTSEKGCCAECGAGWIRQTETTYSNWADGNNNGKAEGRDPRRAHDVKTTGWSPACTHNAPTTPCLVLDPFAGSGTVGVVALRLGRSFLGIELKPEYAEMARRRIYDDAPLLNGVLS